MYDIKPSSEADRLEIRFTDPEIERVAQLSNVPNVGSRRGADGAISHYVFPPHREADVRAAIASGIARAARIAQAALEAAQAADAAAQALVARAEKLDADCARLGVVIGITEAPAMAAAGWGKPAKPAALAVQMPFAGITAAKKLRGIGGEFDQVSKVWSLPLSARADLEAMLPELRRAACSQVTADRKAAAAGIDPKAAYKTKRASMVRGTGARARAEDILEMADDGLSVSREVVDRAERQVFGRRGW